ncbi:hypothetical protein [Xenorhabdus innexi]|uniref:Uncharacterized protein n=1 Tax=Xenorhabdus innexi TaxID=290109 RepID=A0A1N6N0G3_9GAMM|nr:hypothetical protein [Xenorhabdus innexi]PHM33372.1 hypothetical protein Xinn_02531 [Xenorhabdus innexi]SIP74529.1 membrane hypothetical protein [Xenorhabdus innexi]
MESEVSRENIQNNSDPVMPVSNWPVWGMVALPVVGAIIEVVADIAFDWWIYAALNISLWFADDILLKSQNRKIPKGLLYLVLLTPLYLWIRANFLKTDKDYFIGWLLTFILSIIISFNNVSSQMVAETACSVVTDIYSKQYTHNSTQNPLYNLLNEPNNFHYVNKFNDVRCKTVNIDEKMSNGIYYAHAILTNGDSVKIEIEKNFAEIRVAILE